MRISYKMILIFSVMMIVAVTMLTGYATRQSLNDATVFASSRYFNMCDTMNRAVEQQIAMMDLTVEELLDSTSFMATINQFVRDDSADRKMANAARNSILQYMYRSPMVDNYYRISFYTVDGVFVTSRVQKDDYLESGTDLAREVIASLPWLAKADAAPNQRHILPPHSDAFSVRRDTQVYGIVRAVSFHGKQIGYIEVSNEITHLIDTMERVDDESLVAQAIFDDGTVFYSTDDPGFTYPLSLPENELTAYTDPASGVSHTVMRTHSDWLGLNMFLGQDSSVITQRNNDTRWTNIRTAIFIMVPTLALIVFSSITLTRSIRALTKKVQQIPVEHVLENDPEALRALNETVTTIYDAEIHSLEHVFDDVMLHLRDSAVNELSLREGTLQAQLSALQTQINPHFIYNTLNIISAKSMESGNLDVIEICDQFATLLRYSTDTRSRTATLAEEIENVRNYLLLAKARYEENLEFSIDIPDALTGLTVPKMTLQPLVENALTHGYDGQNQKRSLAITGKQEGRQLILEICDNGTGFSPDVLARLQSQLAAIEADKMTVEDTGGHIGLANTCLRLHYYSHGAMHVQIENRGGAVVRLTLPI
ncbi:MAG: histidine kinase [Clostridia bacterium]|nr:histidine kinase [Clostridia bacterium]MBR4359266.1 histidine kinase [Clostridia bacterium]